MPIIPLAVLGAEEAPRCSRGVAAAQAPAQDSASPVAPALPLPAKFRIRFLEPVATDELGRRPGRTGRCVRTLADDIRALIQENLLEMVGERRSVWLG